MAASIKKYAGMKIILAADQWPFTALYIKHKIYGLPRYPGWQEASNIIASLRHNIARPNVAQGRNKVTPHTIYEASPYPPYDLWAKI